MLDNHCWILKSKSIPIEMTSNELLDPSLVHGMQILKLMHCWKFLNVQAIWGDNIWKSREKAEVDIFRVREIFKERTSVSFSVSMWTVNIVLLLIAREQHCLTQCFPPVFSSELLHVVFHCLQHWNGFVSFWSVLSISIDPDG